MKKTYLILIFLLPFTMYCHGNAVSDLEQRLAEIKSLQANFKQELYDQKGGLLRTTNGSLVLQKPNRFRWYTQSPTKQILVADGKKLWLYDIDLEQVTVNNQDKALKQSPANLLSGNIDALLKQYSVTEKPKENELLTFILISKDQKNTFKRIELDFWKNKIHLFSLRDNLGQQTTIKFSKMKYNLPLEPDLFVFIPPKGIDVIDNTV